MLLADPEAAYSFDYTCPRDIGFVIGKLFFVANMAVTSRVDEIKTIQHHLEHIESAKVLRPPDGALLEGGDVILLDANTVLSAARRYRSGVRANDGFELHEPFKKIRTQTTFS